MSLKRRFLLSVATPLALVAACTAPQRSEAEAPTNGHPPAPGQPITEAEATQLDPQSAEFQRRFELYRSMYGEPVQEIEGPTGGGAWLFEKGVLLPYGPATALVSAPGSLHDWTLYGPNHAFEDWALDQARQAGATQQDIDTTREALGGANPVSSWITGPDYAASAALDRSTGAAQQGSHPIFTIYYSPMRDCGGASAGGATSQADYERVNQLVADNTVTAALIVLEPDLLGFLAQGGCPVSEQQETVMQSLRDAIAIHKRAQPETRIYVSVSNWSDGTLNEAHLTQQAELLNQLGVGTEGGPDGFAVDISGDRTNEEMIEVGEYVSARTNGANFITETGRNGAGPQQNVLDDPGRAIGMPPNPMSFSPNHAGSVWGKNQAERDGNFPAIEGCMDTAGTICFRLAAQLVENTPSERALDAVFTPSGASLTFDSGRQLILQPSP